MGTTTSSTDAAIVVPVINVASSVACLRSLGRRNVRTIGISEQDSPPGFHSKYCDETRTVPDPAENLTGYAEALLSLAARRDVQTIIPVREEDIFVLAKHRQEFTEHVEAPWPSLDTLAMTQDRVQLFDAAAAAGVATPETKQFAEWTDWERDVVLKPRYTVQVPEYTGTGHDTEQPVDTTSYIESGYQPDRATVLAEMGHEPLVQEYVPGTDEYGFFALYDHGEAVATFQHRQRRGWKYCGGPSAYRESIANPELDAAGRRLLDHLDWHGLAMVEFLWDEESETFELMEVNPRIWSSLPFTIQAGVDFPHLYWSLANGRRPETPPEYEVGVGGHLLRGELLYLHSILTEDYPLVERPSLVRSVLAIGASMARHSRFDMLSTDDPRPFIQEMRSMVTELANGFWRSSTTSGAGTATELAPKKQLENSSAQTPPWPRSAPSLAVPFDSGIRETTSGEEGDDVAAVNEIARKR